MDRPITVCALFPDHNRLDQAIDALRAAGFAAENLSALMPDAGPPPEEKSTSAPLTGAMSGAAAGGAIGWIAGMTAMMIPGLGPFLAAGPLVAALAGAGAGGAIGGVSGALIGFGLPEMETSILQQAITGGSLLLTVHCATPEDAARAHDLLRSSGGDSIFQSRNLAHAAAR